LRKNLSSDPVTGPLVSEVEPDGKVRGTVKERYFFRRGAGPGWALVGDAGHHKEFVIGDGITEALIQAETLAAAIREGREEALIRWWRERDVEALPGYFWGREEGAPGPPSLLETLLWRHLARDPDAPRLMTKLPEHQATLYDLLPASKVLPWILGAVARGRLGVVPEFLAFGRRARAFRKARREREDLLARARESEQG
jgi:flavin-dependent dehydrogenase